MRLVSNQLGVATREQLFADGMSVSVLRARLTGGRWRALNEHVICMHNGPLTVMQAWWAVVLSARPFGALCGLTGMQSHGARGFESAAVHVLVPHGGRVLPVQGVNSVVHESRRFAVQDIAPRRLPAATTLARATVDAAAWAPNLAAACRVFVAPIQQRLCQPEALRTELLAAGRVRHKRALVSLAHDLCGGAEALSEVEFLRWCRRHGFPQPECQARLDSRGRRRYLDAKFRCVDGRLVYAEIDGGVHLSLTERWRDSSKDNEATLARRTVLRYPSVAIYTDDPIAVGQLRRALDPTCQRVVSL
jgi:hypothetical protein